MAVTLSTTDLMAETHQVTMSEELNSLRSVLRADDHLQIQRSGDFEQVRITLDHDVQICFFVDPLALLTQPFTLNNIHDLRISKLSQKCPLNADQWTDIRKYFSELSDSKTGKTSLQSLVQLTQDRLLQMAVKTGHYKSKERKNGNTSASDDSALGNSRFRGADLIFSRILHDKTIDRSQVIIGYEDRFTGVHEIAFNEFKKVHDHEYGVPMHRIRHYKVNGRLVWDRTKKFDILTGSDELTDTAPTDLAATELLTQGLYQFDPLLHEWVVCPTTPLASDDGKTPSSPEMCLPERCHFVTWNILFDYHHTDLIHTPQRYQAILQTLKSLLPDVICLQEVTMNFLSLLMAELWLQENNYSMIIMRSIVNSPREKTYGQLMLMKNFRPRSFSICLLDDFAEQGAEKKGTKEVLIARFGVNAKITIDLVNVHLHSNRSRNGYEKRCQALENLFKRMQTINFMLIGDFNFGDYDQKEQQLLQQYQDQVHDLWKDVYDIEENPGFTFDPETNVCAHITSDSQIKRRLDRYLVHTLKNLSYSIEHLTMVGMDPIPIDPMNNDADKRVHQSDHYALQLIMNFRTRSISHRSALVVLPTVDTWPLIEPFREQYDPSFNRWPPHINLLWPFFDLTDSEDDEENILLPLRLALAQQASFTAEIDRIDTFTENNITFMKLNTQSTAHAKELHGSLKQLFPQCCVNNRSSYSPHMTIAQLGKNPDQKATFELKESFRFPVQYVYILQRPHDDDEAPFHIAYQLPLGPVLEPISPRLSPGMDSVLHGFFQRMNLYRNDESFARKQDKLQKLSSCFQSIFNPDTLHCFTHEFLPYGSFRIGVHGHDLDTVFVLRELKCTENETSFDRTLRQLKQDGSALTDHVVNLLENQMNGTLSQEISHYRKIQALFPILSILFTDQTQVEIFVQIQINDDHARSAKSPDDAKALATINRSVHGVEDIERLMTYVRCPPVFQHLLTFVRTWAEHVGLYGQAYGYLGGYSWAILCANICHSFFSSISSLSSIEQFSCDQFFSLVRTFFSTYAQWNWSSQAVRLHTEISRRSLLAGPATVQNRGSMRILCPSAPYYNSARSTTNATRDLIHQGFQRVIEVLDTLNTMTPEEKLHGLEEILALKSDFPNEKVQSLLQLTISAETSKESVEWIGWIKSRLVHFLTDCEKDCHLYVQPSNTIEWRSETSENIYSIGFNIDEHGLMTRRNFPHYLNKFLDQCKSCPSRTESMTLVSKVVSAHDWKMQRTQPKPQRIRK